MPICIAGMHRSGTSMVARLLNVCGVYLGTSAELFPPGPDNADGFWEHMGFHALNVDLLSSLGGDWAEVPDMPDGWEAVPEREAFRQRARGLIEGFRDHKLWGWKDPRNSLTLAFWRHLIPDLRVVVPVRNPLEVAASLQKRDQFSLARGLELWSAYHERLLATLPAEGTVITLYDAHFVDGRKELRRILDALQLPVSNRVVARATAACSSQLRHHRLEFARLAEGAGQPLVKPEVWRQLVHNYDQLCAAASMAGGTSNLQGKADPGQSARTPWLVRCLCRARTLIRHSDAA